MGWKCGKHGKEMNIYAQVGGYKECMQNSCRKPLEGYRRRWEINIKMDLREICC
jgi:hypothetical protein